MQHDISIRDVFVFSTSMGNKSKKKLKLKSKNTAEEIFTQQNAFALHLSDKRQLFKLHKEHIKLNNKKQAIKLKIDAYVDISQDIPMIT